MDDQELWYFCPDMDGDDQWQPAMRADLPLRNDAGEVVDDAATWAAQKAEEGKGHWHRPLRTEDFC